MVPFFDLAEKCAQTAGRALRKVEYFQEMEVHAMTCEFYEKMTLFCRIGIAFHPKVWYK